MKKNLFMKSKLVSIAGLILSLSFLSSCSAFFGGDEYTITGTSITTNEEGEQVVTISFSGEVDPLTFTIPQPKDGVGIENVETSLNEGVLTLIISYSDDSLADTVLTIPVLKGDDGRGISNVDVGNDENGNTTIVFNYSDGTSSDLITIPKGTDGIDGVGIKDINIQARPGGLTLITISYTDESMEDDTFTLSNGTSVESVEYISDLSNDSIYVLRFTFSNGETTDVELPRPQGTRWYDGISDPNEDIGRDGDYYLNTVTGEVFRKDGNNEWEAVFSIAGTGSGSSKNYYFVRFNLAEDERFADEESFGSITLQTRVEEGTCLSLEEIPLVEKEGYTFAGRFTTAENNVNSAQFTDLTIVNQDINLFCSWY